MDSEIEDWKCPGCKKIGVLKRKSKLQQCHNTLVLQLMRFDFERNKIHSEIKFGETLDLREHSSEDVRERGDSQKYKLYGVVVHQGVSINHGHYVAYLKAGNSDFWYLADDEDVKMVSEYQVMRQKAHLLFYQKIHN